MAEQEEEYSFYDLFVPLTTKKAITFIIIIGLVVFFNALFNGFVVDDVAYIINNPQIHSFNIPLAFGQNFFSSDGQYRALSFVYFSILYAFAGNTPFIYHVFELVLHITCTYLLYIFFRRYLTQGLSFLLAIIFLIHPMQVESVSYISQTNNALASVFGLTALLLLTREKMKGRAILIGYFLLLLSLLTKETGALYILLVLSYMVIFCRKRLTSTFAASLVIVVIYSFLRFIVAHVYLEPRLLTPIANTSLLQRILNIPAILSSYLYTFFIPLKLSIDQQWVVSRIGLLTFYLPLVLDFFVFGFLSFVGILLYRRKNKYFAPYILFSNWFILGLLLDIQIFPLDKTVSNTWFYFPMMGLLGVLGITYQSLGIRLKIPRNTTIGLLVCIIVLLSFLTIYRNTNYSDEIALYNHDITVDDNYELETSLGSAYLNQKNYTEALSHLQKAVVMRPYELNLLDLGLAYEYTGNPKQAEIFLYQALHSRDYHLFTPHMHGLTTYLSYASVLMLDTNFSNASELIQQNALKDYPDSWQLWMFLSIAKHMSRDSQGAIDAAAKVKQYNLTQTGSSVYVYLISNYSLTRQQLFNILFFVPLQ